MRKTIKTLAMGALALTVAMTNPLSGAATYLTAFGPTHVSAQTQDIKVNVFGELVNFPDQQPVIVEARTLVPVRGVFEAMGFDVQWSEEMRTVFLRAEGYEIQIPVDRDTFTANGQTITPDVPQRIINGRTMLPLRAIAEAAGVYVDWVENTRTVMITRGAPGTQPTPTPTTAPTPRPDGVLDWRTPPVQIPVEGSPNGPYRPVIPFPWEAHLWPDGDAMGAQREAFMAQGLSWNGEPKPDRPGTYNRELSEGRGWRWTIDEWLITGPNVWRH